MKKFIYFLVVMSTVMSVARAKPVNEIAMELGIQTIKHSQNDHREILSYIFQLQNNLKELLNSPEDKKALDECMILIERLKKDLKKFAMDYVMRVNKKILELNRALTEFANKKPSRSKLLSTKTNT